MNKLLIAVILGSSIFVSGCGTVEGVASVTRSDDHFADDAAAVMKMPTKDLTVSNVSKSLMSTSYTVTTKTGHVYTCMTARSIYMTTPLQCYKAGNDGTGSPFH